MTVMLWQQIAQGCARLECLALTAPGWGRAILFREIKVLDRFALHILEPFESSGEEIRAFFLHRIADLLRELRPLAALLRRSEMGDWSTTIDQLQDAILTV